MPTATADPLTDRLRAILGPGGVMTAPSELAVYECDAFTIAKNRPGATPPPKPIPPLPAKGNRPTPLPADPAGPPEPDDDLALLEEIISGRVS